MGDSDDDMPPLEYVGAVPGVTNPAAKQVDDDDDMPPLEYVGTLPTSTAGKEEEDDDDMPPLEYVGTDASLGISLREGERVTLKGLSKDSLNGQTGTLQSFAKASKGRLPVKLDKTGSMLAVKPENIEKLSAPVAKSAGAMPPLQSVGASAKGAAAYPAASAKGASAPKPAAQASPQANGASHGHTPNGQDKVDRPLPVAKARGSAAPAQAPPAPTPAQVPVAQAPAAPAPVPVVQAPPVQVPPATPSPPVQAQVPVPTPKPVVPVVSKSELPRAEAPKAKSAIESWCEELQLPPDLLQRLVDEEVMDPEELTGIDDDELQSLAKGLKIGPKGRFIKAVKKMKALEAAELGSSC